MAQRPNACGLLLCEQVIIEEGTKNLTPVNCFTHRTVRQFPSQPFPFVVFAVLTDGFGKMPLEVAVQRLDNLDESYRRSGQIEFRTPLQQRPCIIRIRDCSFPVAGDYQVMLLVDHELVAQQRLRILLKGGAA
jgi:hypothetical protein